MTHRLSVVPFVNPKPKTVVEMALDEVRSISNTIEDIVILVRDKSGDIISISNQGDSAGVIYFVEKAKLKLLEPKEPPKTGPNPA